MSIIDARGPGFSRVTRIQTTWSSRDPACGYLPNPPLTDFAFIPRDTAGRPVANRGNRASGQDDGRFQAVGDPRKEGVV